MSKTPNEITRRAIEQMERGDLMDFDQQIQSMTSLETLLREWAAIEPGRCVFTDDHWYVCIMAVWTPLPVPENHLYAAKVQAAVQEAIEARGWIWHMQNAFNQDGADCYVAYLSGINEEEEFACDTPAEALLTAYLQTLKANA